ncbi:MAG TPA: hypothetical protein DCZ92_11065, partial [Elusimicrobia bacterium]|nr:hypothetical protein [Elusimicrobiota bacterium]
MPARSRAGARAGTAQSQREVVSGQALVKFNSNISSDTRKSRLNAAGFELVKEISNLGWTLVNLPAGVSVSAGLGLLKLVEGIEAAEPNNVYRPKRTPNDPGVSSQYALQNMRAYKAWDYETGTSSRVTVAVIDTGIDASHPEISGKLIGTSRFFDPVNGAPSNNQPPTAACNHATRVAGIAAAESDNSAGLAGITWGGKLLSLKVFSDSDCSADCIEPTCGTSESSIASAIADVTPLHNTATYGKIVINLSLGSQGDCSSPLQASITNATTSGVMVVAAGGNSAASLLDS